MKNSSQHKNVSPNWAQVVEAAQKENPGLATLLRSSALASVDDDKALIATKYGSFKEKLEEDDIRLTLTALLATLYGVSREVQIVLERDVNISISPLPEPENERKRKSNPQKTPQNNLLKDAQELMGGTLE
jgi:hypothetical protein